MRMKRKRRKSRERMDRIELSKEMTRLRRLAQYFVTLTLLEIIACFASPWSHLEDPQESEGTKDGEAKLSGLWPFQRSFSSTLFCLYKVSV